jgi:type I restriction enzyme S subunit
MSDNYQMSKKGWQECRLGDIIDVKHGYAFKGEFFSDEQTENILVTPGNFQIGGGFKSDKLKFYSGEVPTDYILQTNDVIVTMTDLSKEADTLGYSAVVPEIIGKKLLHNQRLGRVTCKSNDANIIFINWLLRTEEYRWHIIGSASGSTVSHTSPSRILEYPFLLPPLPEQRAIAGVLSSLDDKIDLLHRQNKTLEGMAEALWRKMFAEEADPGWETTTIGEVATINGKSIDKEYTFAEIEYLDTGSLTEGRISEYQYLQLKDTPSRARRIVQKNDIVISMVRPIQKHYGILKKVNHNTIVSTGFVVITCIEIDPHFIYVLLTQKEMTEYLDIIAEASTTTYPSLVPSDIAKIDFQIPPTELMQQFSEYAEHAWDKIEENNSQIRTLSHLRDTLLPKLMSGEVKVKL